MVVSFLCSQLSWIPRCRLFLWLIVWVVILIVIRNIDFLMVDVVLSILFFFQAEDGIRDLTVTGVQTCALPISPRELHVWLAVSDLASRSKEGGCATAETSGLTPRRSRTVAAGEGCEAFREEGDRKSVV